MAIDFDALDLVRSQNRSREYNKKVKKLQQQVADLQELVTDVALGLPDEKKSIVEERLKKIKESS